jgi:hypothetical protein
MKLNFDLILYEAQIFGQPWIKLDKPGGKTR